MATTTSTVSWNSNCELLLFIGCKTGLGEASLPQAAVNAGAECAIGFRDSINCDEANKWTIAFFNAYLNGYSIQQAAEHAADLCDDSRLRNIEIVMQ